jgi:hypothetical protein
LLSLSPKKIHPCVFNGCKTSVSNCQSKRSTVFNGGSAALVQMQAQPAASENTANFGNEPFQQNSSTLRISFRILLFIAASISEIWTEKKKYSIDVIIIRISTKFVNELFYRKKGFSV